MLDFVKDQDEVWTVDAYIDSYIFYYYVCVEGHNMLGIPMTFKNIFLLPTNDIFNACSWPKVALNFIGMFRVCLRDVCGTLMPLSCLDSCHVSESNLKSQSKEKYNFKYYFLSDFVFTRFLKGFWASCYGISRVGFKSLLWKLATAFKSFFK